MSTRDPLFPDTDNLDDWFPRAAGAAPGLIAAGQRLGVVVGGSPSSSSMVSIGATCSVPKAAVPV